MLLDCIDLQQIIIIIIILSELLNVRHSQTGHLFWGKDSVFGLCSLDKWVIEKKAEKRTPR